MQHSDLLFVFFVIFFGASVFATFALFTRQTLIIAYMLLGVVVGPFGLKIINSTEVIIQVSNIGIMFLLFLLGLNLQLKNMMKMLNKTILVTFVSSSIFACMTVLVCHYYGFSWSASLIIGASLIFSSTIICLKLLPTTALHHQHIGNIVISVLLLQDIIAIVMLTGLGILSVGVESFGYFELIRVFLALPVLLLVGYLAEKYVLFQLLRHFNRFQEYIFLLAIGWCLGMAQLAFWLGVPHEIGAFIAGVTLASSPISQYIYENLKPLRDFFLIVFFFSIGAAFDFTLAYQVIAVVLVLTVMILVMKPIVYWFLLLLFKEERKTAWEVGVRLGQASEFSLLIAFMAVQSQLLDNKAYIVIQAVTMLTFVFSSYFVVLKLPNPVAVSDKLRRD